MGLLRGNNADREFGNQIEVLSASFEILLPFNDSLEVQSVRKYKPMFIHKHVDRNSPLLMRMLVSNEIFTTFELTFLARSENDRFNRNGDLKPEYRIRLVGAHLLSYTLSPAKEDKNLNPNEIPSLEVLSVGFDAVNFLHIIHQTEVEDSIHKAGE